MVQINHKIGNFFFSILAGIVINGTMRSAIWEYLRGTFAFPQQCPPASLSTLYCSLHFTPAALIGSLHFHCFIFFYTAVVVIRKGNQPCPASWRHSCSSQSWSASPEPSVSFCFHHFFLNDKILFWHAYHSALDDRRDHWQANLVPSCLLFSLCIREMPLQKDPGVEGHADSNKGPSHLPTDRLL